MASLLLIGMLIGMRHALDADHVAAVASLTSRNRSLGDAFRQGGAWGLGHTFTLFLFGSIVIFMDTVMPERLAGALEMAVGVMLVLLGGDLLRRVVSDRVHFHAHRHGTQSHFHAHSHAGEAVEHDPARHHHKHPRGFPLRALAVGLMHGMAGSAAVILLALESVASPLEGLLYILVFGIGSMFGMALLSVAISIPLHLSAGKLTWAHNGFQLAVGLFTVGLGLLVIHERASLLPV